MSPALAEPPLLQPRPLDHFLPPRPNSGPPTAWESNLGGLICRHKARMEGSARMPQVTLTVNGKSHTVDVEGRTLLVELLREKLGLTGTHVGCDTSQCGACVVHVDGISAKSCTMLALQADGCAITTIEGLAAADGTLHPMQEMFREHHALQCGFCTPGMVMSAIDMVNSHPDGLTEKQIREGLEGNLCRCTGYHNIVKAIAAAWPLMHQKAAAAE
jgi:aerobic carbon-monoxide dehydrogenase small subunit